MHAATPAVGAVWHSGPTQLLFWHEYVHATAAPHCPHALHVCTPVVPEHWVAPGVQTGVDGHEQAPQPQLELHVCVP